MFVGKTAVGLSRLCDNPDQDYYSCRTEDKAEASRGDKTCSSLCTGVPEARRAATALHPTYLNVLHEPVALPTAGQGLARGRQGRKRHLHQLVHA